LHLARIEAEGSTQSRATRRVSRSASQVLRSASGLALAATALVSIAGCGNTYRPVVSAINPVGPAAQPQKFAVVISSTGTALKPTPGLVTFVDFSGDTILITANIGVNPYYLILSNNGTTGYTLNSDHTLTTFGISTSLIQSQILQTTLLPGADPVSIFPQGNNTYVSDPGLQAVSQFTGQPLNLQQELAIPPGFTPIYVTGNTSAPRVYAITPSTSGGLGQVSPIEATNTIDAPIPVGRGPVYGVMTADNRRAFIMNQTDGTVSVINAQTNRPDDVPSGATNPIVVGQSPLWADFAPVRNEMVVANAGDGVNPGSVSIISIPLCTANALPTNPNCDPNNPVDAVGFGTVLATVPVGINPRMIYVLQDVTDSRAYVVNGGNPNLPCSGAGVTGPSTSCSVSVINLNTNTVTATIPLPLSLTGSGNHNGHPNYLAVTNGTPTGKVYVTSPDSNFMTIIRTDIDAVDTTVPLQGNGVSVRITAP
jgi:DNA-binding beta-propeller fold protein YncE